MNIGRSSTPPRARILRRRRRPCRGISSSLASGCSVSSFRPRIPEGLHGARRDLREIPMTSLTNGSAEGTIRPSWRSRGKTRRWIALRMPQLAVAPSLAIIALVVYGFMLWTAYISLSRSSIMPNYEWAGLIQYQRLWSNPLWWIAVKNIFVFGFLFIAFSTIVGLSIAIFLDQRISDRGRR